MATADDYMIVAAIDFGTTYSGYAFQLTSHYNPDDPTKHIMSPQAWNNGTTKHASLKTPTCLLLDPRAEIDSFGYLAEEKYAELCLEKKNKDWYFFRRFKMNLHDTKDLNRKTMLTDQSGRKLEALKVFGLSIKCLKTSLEEVLTATCTSSSADKDEAVLMIGERDVKWVLTVPAIWDDPSKQFMREAAKLAGIESAQLRLALEPEAASLLCQYLPVERFSVGNSTEFKDSKPGTTYMIVDLGGGTADITVHEKLVDGKLKEIHRASGGPWGGTAVDSAFIKLFSDIIGGPVFSTFMKEQTYDYLDLMRDFEAVKRRVGMATTANVNVRIPVSLNETCTRVVKKNFKELVMQARKDKEISFTGDKAVFDVQLMKGLFKKTTDKIVAHIKTLLSTTEAGRKVSLLLMVGGFSESAYVQDVIKAEFNKGGCKVLIPHDAGISVVQGAVVFGRRPETITSRVLKCAYGAKVVKEFDKDKHDRARMTKDATGRNVSHDIFGEFIKAGVEVSTGHVVEKEYRTAKAFQSDTDLTIYFSTADTTPLYVDHCTIMGKLTVKIPKPTKEIRTVAVKYVFGDTEIFVSAVDMATKTPCSTILKMIE